MKVVGTNATNVSGSCLPSKLPSPMLLPVCYYLAGLTQCCTPVKFPTALAQILSAISLLAHYIMDVMHLYSTMVVLRRVKQYKFLLFYAESCTKQVFRGVLPDSSFGAGPSISKGERGSLPNWGTHQSPLSCKAKFSSELGHTAQLARAVASSSVFCSRAMKRASNHRA